MLKLEHFYYINEIAKVGTINKAAENLYLSQPYLSAILKEIESELNISLFKRSSRGVTLTPAGEMFLEYAKEIIDIMYQVKSLHKIQNKDFTRLSISSMYSFTILDIFNNFSRKKHDSQCSIQYEEIPNDFIPDKVSKGYSDIGIVYVSSKDLPKFQYELKEKKLTFTPLVKEPIYAVFNSEHDLAQKSNILFEDLKPYSFIVEKIKQPNKSPSVENYLLPEIFKSLPRNQISFDNNRSLLYYLTRNVDCFTIGQKSLNLTSPFVTNNSLKYVPIENLPVEMITGYITNNKSVYSALHKDFINDLTTFFSQNLTDQ